MKKEIADKWVEALRSGKYKQTKNHLKDECGYCCLGVLCDISNLGSWDIGAKSYGGMSGALCDKVRDWAGISNEAGYFLDGGNLINFNDVEHLDFNQIAKLIEQKWKEL